MAGPPRLLRIENEADARHAVMSVGADPKAAGRMAAKMVGRAIRLTAIPCAAANILKQEMLSLGGDAAVAKGCVACSVPVSDVILIGCLRKIRLLCDRINAQPYGLAALAGKIHKLLQACERPEPELIGRNCRLDLRRPLIMGILNVTPDSFSDGGRFQALEQALSRARQMVAEGADILDVGGESTRPGAAEVGAEEELARVVPVIEAFRRESDLPISVDTTKSQVARAALAAGANFVNDISGLTFDPAMLKVASEAKAGIFLMHTPGRPESMQTRTRYQDLIGEVLEFLEAAVQKATAAGICRERLCIDPGIGFGKTPQGNLEILRRLDEFRSLGLPILLGTSRKSFIGKVLEQPVPSERLHGTLATLALGIDRGANILRVHDVRPAKEASLMAWALCNEAQSTHT